jgi:hypothetical protein
VRRDQTHGVMVFDEDTDAYSGFNRELSVLEFAMCVESGEAAAHDLYWAFFQQRDEAAAGAAPLHTTDAAAAFMELEGALGLRSSSSCGGGRGGGDDASPLTVWAGPAGHVEFLHYDANDNLHLVVCGRKHWLLFPPADAFCNNKLNYVGLLPALWARIRGGPPPSAGNPNRKMLGDPAMVGLSFRPLSLLPLSSFLLSSLVLLRSSVFVCSLLLLSCCFFSCSAMFRAEMVALIHTSSVRLESGTH